VAEEQVEATVDMEQLLEAVEAHQVLQAVLEEAVVHQVFILLELVEA
jgi:hypothetical protein